ncbi:unnamed protein product [Sympodiomycopsis kandeliae]
MSQTPPLTSEQTKNEYHAQQLGTESSDPTSAQHGDAKSSPSGHRVPISVPVLNPSELAQDEPRYVRAQRRNRKDKTVKDATKSHGKDGHAEHIDQEEDDQDQDEEPLTWISTLPAETLSRIVGHLDPISLSRASAVCRTWNRIVKDDVTWREALSNAFSISQDGSGASIALRRTKKTSWKAEYIHRSDLIKRWKRSRAPAISSDMRVSNIHAIAFSEAHSFMLSASMVYGVASRSDPFKGKVARGFVDAAGVLNGAGIGNPNVEFSPHVTAIGLSTDASRIAWGFKDGTLAMTIMTRQGSNPRGMIRSIRFSSRGSHSGPISAIAFDLNQRGQTRRQHRRIAMGEAADCFVTGGEDGRVRLWNHHRPFPLWFASAQADDVATDTSNGDSAPRRAALTNDCVTQVELDADLGIIVAGTRSGDVHVWTGLNVSNLLGVSSSAWDSADAEIQTPAQIKARKTLALEHARARHFHLKASDEPLRRKAFERGDQKIAEGSVSHLYLDAEAANDLTVVVHRGSDSYLSCYQFSPREVEDSLVDSDDTIVRTHILKTSASMDAITCLRIDCAPASVVDHQHRTPSSASGTPQHSASPSPALQPTIAPQDNGLASPTGLVLGPAPGSVRNLKDGVFAERKFVCAGTSSGQLYGWPLPTSTISGPLESENGPNFKLDCHHTALTCIDFTPHLFAVGTSDGTVKAFNSLTGDLVRTWNERTATRHAARMLNEGTLTAEEADRFRVRQILIGEESIVAAIGPFLLAWKPGSATSGRRNKGNGPGQSSNASSSKASGKSTPSGKSAMPPLSKYAQMREIRTELAESSATLAKEREQRQASYDRIRYNRGTADLGGLNEDEALEYAMMLSREDEEARQISLATANDAAETSLSEQTRQKQEEAELQDALEQIALLESGTAADESSANASGRASDADPSSFFDDDDGGEEEYPEYEEFVEESADYSWGSNSNTNGRSPGSSPGMSAYGSPHQILGSRARHRYRG